MKVFESALIAKEDELKRANNLKDKYQSEKDAIQATLDDLTEEKRQQKEKLIAVQDIYYD